MCNLFGVCVIRLVCRVSVWCVRVCNVVMCLPVEFVRCVRFGLCALLICVRAQFCYSSVLCVRVCVQSRFECIF